MDLNKIYMHSGEIEHFKHINHECFYEEKNMCSVFVPYLSFFVSDLHLKVLVMHFGVDSNMVLEFK